MSSRGRVLEIVSSFKSAGGERMTVDLSRGLHGQGWDVHVVAIAAGPLSSVLDESGIPYTVVHGGFDSRAPATLARVRRIIRSFKPDIVHTHLVGADVIGQTAAALEGTRIVVSTQHDTYERPPYVRAFRRMTAKRLAAAVAISPAVIGYCSTRLHVEPARVATIINGIDIGRFARPGRIHAHPRPDHPFTVGAAGTLIPVKGHDILIRAMAEVIGRRPDARLVIAGPGDPANLRGLARSLGVEGHVEFLGAVDDMASFYESIDVLAHPSRMEALGLAVLEGMASGCPIVATDLPALRHTLLGGELGVLCPPEDPGSLARALVALADDPERRIALAVSGRAAVDRRFSHLRCAARYGELFDALLAGEGVPDALICREDGICP